MKTYMRTMLVTAGLMLAATACDRGKAERDRLASEADKRSQEAEITAAKMKSDSEEAAKKRAERAEDKQKLQQKFDAQERKAIHLKEKAGKAVGKTKLNANAAMAELDARRNTAKTSLGRLTEDSAAWDTAKKAAEDDVDSFEKSVETLDHTLSNK